VISAVSASSFGLESFFTSFFTSTLPLIGFISIFFIYFGSNFAFYFTSGSFTDSFAFTGSYFGLIFVSIFLISFGFSYSVYSGYSLTYVFYFLRFSNLDFIPPPIFRPPANPFIPFFEESGFSFDFLITTGFFNTLLSV